MSVRFGCQLCFGQRSSLFLIQAREAVPHVAEFGESPHPHRIRIAVAGGFAAPPPERCGRRPGGGRALDPYAHGPLAQPANAMDGPQRTWTNHLGIDSPCGRKLPRGVLYYATPPAQCLDAVMRPLLEAAHHRAVAKPTPILFHRFDRVRDALKPMMTNAWAALQAPEQKTPRLLQWFRGVACALVSVVAASINALASAMGLRTSDPTVEAVDERIGEPVPPMQQIRVKVDGATVMVHAATNWTENDVKVALAEKLGRSLGDDYYFVAGGKALNDGNGTTLGALGVVGRGCVLELRRRMRAGTRPTADELAAALKLFDSDGDGMLSPAELKAILCRPSTGVVVCPLGGSTRSSRSLTQTGMACCQCGRAGQSVVSAEASDGGGAT